MNTNLLNQLENVLNGNKCKTLANYFFTTRVLVSTIANMTNDTESYKVTLDYYKNSINFENYIGLEYSSVAETQVKNRRGELITKYVKDKTLTIDEETLKNPLFRAALVTISNIQLVQTFMIPDRFDSYDVRQKPSELNLWAVLLDRIIEDGTLDNDTVYWIMIFGLLLKESDSDRNLVISKFASEEYETKVHDHLDKVRPYHYLIKNVIDETEITTYSQRFYNFNNTNLYLNNLNCQRKELCSVLKMLDVYKTSKYYNPTVEELYLGIPIFDNVKTTTGYSSVFDSRYKWSTDSCSFKRCISNLAEINSSLNTISNETVHYKDFINDVNTIFIDNCVKLINTEYSGLFSTKTIGAMKRVKYGRSLTKSEIEGFKFITEIADEFEDKKFAKSIKKYYTDTIL